MFSLHDIDDQIWVMRNTADDLEKQADELPHPAMQSALRGAVNAFRSCARMLEQMIERTVEAEAREALR